MTTITWIKAYNIGVRMIDKDHRNLFDMIRKIDQETGKNFNSKKIGKAIENLIQYTEDHFAREEQLMKRYEYPGLEKHKVQHRNLEQTVYALYRVYLAEPESVDTKKLMLFLNNWLSDHILNIDMDYAKYLENNQFAGNLVQYSDEKEGNKKISMELSACNADLLKRCDLLLNQDGEEAQRIQEILDPFKNMTLVKAKQLAQLVLR